MLYKSIASLLLLAGLQAVSAQNSTTACNNSPSLCSKQYNNITYLGAHDSPFLRNAETSFSTSGNQFYNTTAQLASGVRLVTGQIQNPSNSTALHMCHTSCDLLDAGTLESWLSEIKTWMDANPNDVVTILLVNGPGATASELAAAYTSSGMDQYAYTPASTSASSTWPTLESMISNGTRAVNFVSTLSDNSGATYLMNEFDYVFENSYENYNASDFSCEVNRPTNLANQTSNAISSGYMSLMNHFLYVQQAFGIESPNEDAIQTTNAPSGGGSGNLGDHALKCSAQYGKAPTFMLVDFSNVGPAIDTADSLNGVSNPTGRTSLPDTPLSETSAATIALPQSTTLCLGLGTALLSMLLL